MTPISTDLRSIPATMLGTDMEDIYWLCHKAADEIDRLHELHAIATGLCGAYARRAGYLEGAMEVIANKLVPDPHLAARRVLKGAGEVPEARR